MGNTNYNAILNETVMLGIFYSMVHKTLESIGVYTGGLGFRLQGCYRNVTVFVLTVIYVLWKAGNSNQKVHSIYYSMYRMIPGWSWIELCVDSPGLTQTLRQHLKELTKDC